MNTVWHRAILVPTTTPFGERPRALRLARNVSQARLAQSAGLGHSYLSRLESGQRAPSRETVAVLAAELHLPPCDAAGLYQAAGFWPDDAPWQAAALAIADLLADPALLSPADRPAIEAAHRILTFLA